MNKSLPLHKNIFTNSQIRAVAGTGYLQKQELYTLGQAISTLLTEEFDESCNILIASDPRSSTPWIKEALLKGLAVDEHNIYDAGICPTPFVAKALKDYQPTSDDQEEKDEFEPDEEKEGFFALGIMITASHNSAEYNGIKILTEFGYLTPEIEMEISDIFHEYMQDYEEIPKETPYSISIDLINFYDTAVMQQLNNTPMNKISVTVDCAYGATALIAPQIFKSAGINVVAIHNEQDGTRINNNSGCSNPELLLEAVLKNNTEWGCAFDGDGDRVIIVHKSGKIFDGDDLLVMLSLHPDYHEYKTLIGTFMTNQGVVEFAQNNKMNLIRTQVGERNVIQALMHHQAMLGSETCGHITVMDHAFCSDGIFAALLFFDTITSHPEILQTHYTKYPQLHATIPLKDKTLDTKTISAIVSQYQNQTTRIVVRSSNTEPILRIMVEQQNLQEAQTILDHLKQLFIKAIH